LLDALVLIVVGLKRISVLIRVPGPVGSYPKTKPSNIVIDVFFKVYIIRMREDCKANET
jgi:hypothetical protein